MDLLASDPTKFNAAKFRSLFDSFANPLQEHLAAEIDTLLDLKNYAHTGLDYVQVLKDSQVKAIASNTMTESLPVIMLNHDRTFGDGCWPEIPLPVSLWIRKVAPCYHWGWWKFASCDSGQWPKDLPY